MLHNTWQSVPDSTFKAAKIGLNSRCSVLGLGVPVQYLLATQSLRDRESVLKPVSFCIWKRPSLRSAESFFSLYEVRYDFFFKMDAHSLPLSIMFLVFFAVFFFFFHHKVVNGHTLKSVMHNLCVFWSPDGQSNKQCYTQHICSYRAILPLFLSADLVLSLQQLST